MYRTRKKTDCRTEENAIQRLHIETQISTIDGKGTKALSLKRLFNLFEMCMRAIFGCWFIRRFGPS